MSATYKKTATIVGGSYGYLNSIKYSFIYLFFNSRNNPLPAS